MAWVTAGAGRMLRSPTVWEDVVKTICTTNCTWALTRVMVRALVSELGDPAAGHLGDPLANAFPTPAAMAARDEAFYREVVRAGYRAPRFVELATIGGGGRGRPRGPGDGVARRSSRTRRSSGSCWRCRAWGPTPRPTS